MQVQKGSKNLGMMASRAGTKMTGGTMSVIANNDNPLPSSQGVLVKSSVNRGFSNKRTPANPRTNTIRENLRNAMQTVVTLTSLTGMVLSEVHSLNVSQETYSIVEHDYSHVQIDASIKNAILDLVAKSQTLSIKSRREIHPLEKLINQQLDELYRTLTDDAVYF